MRLFPQRLIAVVLACSLGVDPISAAVLPLTAPLSITPVSYQSIYNEEAIVARVRHFFRQKPLDPAGLGSEQLQAEARLSRRTRSSSWSWHVGAQAGAWATLGSFWKYSFAQHGHTDGWTLMLRYRMMQLLNITADPELLTIKGFLFWVGEPFLEILIGMGLLQIIPQFKNKWISGITAGVLFGSATYFLARPLQDIYLAIRGVAPTFRMGLLVTSSQWTSYENTLYALVWTTLNFGGAYLLLQVPGWLLRRAENRRAEKRRIEELTQQQAAGAAVAEEEAKAREQAEAVRLAAKQQRREQTELEHQRLQEEKSRLEAEAAELLRQIKTFGEQIAVALQENDPDSAKARLNDPRLFELLQQLQNLEDQKIVKAGTTQETKGGFTRQKTALPFIQHQLNKVLRSADTQLKKGQWQEALEALKPFRGKQVEERRRMVGLVGDHLTQQISWLQQGRQAMEKKQYAEALLAFEQALPDAEAARTLPIARRALEKEKADQANEAAFRAGLSAKNRQDYHQAERHFAEAAKDGTHPNAPKELEKVRSTLKYARAKIDALNAASTAIAEGRLSEALELSERAGDSAEALELRSNAENALSTIARAEKKWRGGEPIAALKTLDTLKEGVEVNALKTQIQDAMERKELFEAGEAALTAYDYEKAISYGERAVPHPGSAALLDLAHKGIEQKASLEKARRAADRGDIRDALVLVDQAGSLPGVAQLYLELFTLHLKQLPTKELLMELRKLFPESVRWPTDSQLDPLARWILLNVMTAPDEDRNKLHILTTLEEVLAHFVLLTILPGLRPYKAQRVTIAKEFLERRRSYSIIPEMDEQMAPYAEQPISEATANAWVDAVKENKRYPNGQLPGKLRDLLPNPPSPSTSPQVQMAMGGVLMALGITLPFFFHNPIALDFAAILAAAGLIGVGMAYKRDTPRPQTLAEFNILPLKERQELHNRIKNTVFGLKNEKVDSIPQKAADRLGLSSEFVKAYIQFALPPDFLDGEDSGAIQLRTDIANAKAAASRKAQADRTNWLKRFHEFQRSKGLLPVWGIGTLLAAHLLGHAAGANTPAKHRLAAAA